MNDVVLAAVAGAIRQWQIHRQIEVHDVRVMVPVSMRGDHTDLGNRVAMVVVDLPVTDRTALMRLDRVHSAMERAKTSGASASSPQSKAESAPSIHDIEESLSLGELPPADLDDRALFIERVLPAWTTIEAYTQAEYEPLASTARLPMAAEVEFAGDTVVISLTSRDDLFSKRLTFFPDGLVHANFSWRASEFPPDAWFTTEISVSRPVQLRTAGATVWEHAIETVAKSERGLDRTLQGTSYLVRWPVHLGSAEVEIQG